MADIELVIKLDEEYIKQIDKIKFLIGGRAGRSLQVNVINAIKNGIALPKGHGRLIDADAATKDINAFHNAFAKYTDNMGKYNIVCTALTVIEADKEEKT